VTMISLGGVIGAGLFVGSGAVINQTGPAAVLSYLLAGLLIVFVLAEGARRQGAGARAARPGLVRDRASVRVESRTTAEDGRV